MNETRFEHLAGVPEPIATSFIGLDGRRINLGANEMKNFRRLAVGIDTAPLLARIGAHPELWESGRQRERYGQAEAILVRGPARADDPLAWLYELDQIDYEALYTLAPELPDLVLGVIERVGRVKHAGRVMITRLPPGGRIAPHIDEGRYADLYDRFHLCLDADEGSSFRCGGEAVVMAPGDFWWFNHKREHEVVNAGGRARVHLVLDLDTIAYKALRGTTFQAERLSDLWDEIEPLFELHYREIAHYQDIALHPHEEAYEALERLGQLRTYTVREGGALVGYVTFFVRLNHHYADSLQAWQDLLFLLPEHRRGRTGITLIRVAETRLRAEGVQVVYHHAKRSNNLGELLECLGYEPVEGIYAKRLDKKKGA